MRHIVLFLVIFSLAGCTSTSVSSSRYIKGDRLQTEQLSEEKQRTNYMISMGSDSATLTRRDYFSQAEKQYYQKIKEERIQQVTNGPSADLPLCLIALPFVILAADFGCFVDKDYDYYDEETTLPGETIVENNTRRYSQDSPVVDVPVSISIQGASNKINPVTNQQGSVRYDFLQLLKASDIHPEKIIHGQGVTVKASTQFGDKSYHFKNKAIADEYFREKYNQYQMTLLGNQARHDNCQTIAASYREFFECYYQKGLL